MTEPAPNPVAALPISMDPPVPAPEPEPISDDTLALLVLARELSTPQFKHLCWALANDLRGIEQFPPGLMPAGAIPLTVPVAVVLSEERANTAAPEAKPEPQK